MFSYLRDFALPSVLVALVSYLLGSISSSIIFTKVFDNNLDIRTMGSGNAGATNVLRSVGVKAAIFTFIFDFAKGAVSVMIGRAVFQYVCTQAAAPLIVNPHVVAQYGAYIAGVACVFGHIYPLYFGFKGGKGVLTSAAMIALIDWRVFLIVIGVFLALFLTTQIVSLSSICAAAAFPVATFIITFFIDFRGSQVSAGPVPISYVWVTTAIAFCMGFVLIYKHRTNIQRIKNGTEKKITINHRT